MTYPAKPILLVDDERFSLKSCERILKSNGITNTLLCEDSRTALGTVHDNDVSVMLLDLSMPHVSGENILRNMAEQYPDIPVIIITGANLVETAVECMKLGAFDYMVKPVEANRLVSGVKRAIEICELRLEYRALKSHMLAGEVMNPSAFSGIVSQNSHIKSICSYLESVAVSSKPVLITGETGTGKELFSRAVHALSGVTGELVTINVAGLDDNMLSDTLFGHVKGAYTGAAENREGLIASAAGGTLFLDEIGDLSMASQVKLLRLLEDRHYYPLGSDAARLSNARIIAATNRDLDTLKSSGRFRTDLYYRLTTHHVHIPPLRSRIDDIPLLVSHFLDKAAKSLGKAKPTPPRELFTLLGTYSFPGNVRELEAMVFDAVSVHESRMLSLDVFKTRIGSSSGNGTAQHNEDDHPVPIAFGTPLPTLEEARELHITEALRRSEGNQGIAADMLGISRTALNKRLKRIREKN